MQRWIVTGVVAIFRLVGGSGVACRTYKQGRPCPMWVALPLYPRSSHERRGEIATHLMNNTKKIPEVEATAKGF